MLINENFKNFKFENFLHKFKNSLNKVNTDSIIDFSNPISLIKNSPEIFFKSVENKKIILRDLENDTILKIFHCACNMLKEIERKTKLTGLKILRILNDSIDLNEDLFMNAYVFEKDMAKSFSNVGESKRNKLVSIGDYELTKYESDFSSNFGFFAAPLEEEKKEIKNETMNLIACIGEKAKNKEFAIKSFKYTIELVNDEEDEVRFTTLRCLEKLIKNFKYIDVRRILIFIF
jgi:hypothetical protein